MLKSCACFVVGTYYIQVDFEYDAAFSGNQVLTDGPGSAGDGGGLCVASSGDVVFEDSATFTANEAESGGQGGAVANFGHLVFKSASTFASNSATGEFGSSEGSFLPVTIRLLVGYSVTI